MPTKNIYIYINLFKRVAKRKKRHQTIMADRNGMPFLGSLLKVEVSLICFVCHMIKKHFEGNSWVYSHWYRVRTSLISTIK